MPGVGNPGAVFDPFAGPPRLHGARRVGFRPGTEVIHPLGVSGERPLAWHVDGLPPGISVDEDGILRGTAPGGTGSWLVSVQVSNALGAIDESVELCFGDTLALTPPRGWNSWNVYGSEVTAEVVMRMADAMVESGMRDLGYAYVNIDDHWHAERRAADGRPQANPVTFPDGIEAAAKTQLQLDPGRHVVTVGVKLDERTVPLRCELLDETGQGGAQVQIVGGK